MNAKLKRRMIIAAVVVGVFVLAGLALLCHPAFGGIPEGTRLERMRRSPNFVDGQFRNQEPTEIITSDENILVQLWTSMFPGVKDLKPDEPLKAVNTNLHSLDTDTDQIVWFGHSSYLLTMGGRRIMVDPVLTTSFPASLTMRPFKGTDIYSPDDMPAIDLLVITHDHYDHLDYPTVKRLRKRVRRVICPLGVGAHLERWGYEPSQITEMDWGERREYGGVKVTCLPARHFSGRLFRRNGTLWASYMLQSPGLTLYVGGDSGYGKHLQEIGRRFPEIDVALLEAGQYDAGWNQIHTMPEYQDSTISALHPRTVIPVHNSKYKLARHPWREPINTMQGIAARDTSFRLLLPVIGEPMPLR